MLQFDMDLPDGGSQESLQVDHKYMHLAGQLEVAQMCKEHETKPLEYYCEDDEEIICSRCVIMGKHKDHNISSIEDKNRLIINEMEPNLQMANHVIRRLKRIDKEVLAYMSESRKEVGPVLKEVTQHFKHLHKVLEDREKQIHLEVAEVFNTGIEPIRKLRADMQTEYRQLDASIKAAHRIMNNNDEIIVNAKEILDMLIHSKDIPCILEQCSDETSTKSISFSPSDTIDTVLLSHGQVTGQLAKRFEMFTMRDKPEKFTEDVESLGMCTIIPDEESLGRSTPTDSYSRATTPLDACSVTSTTASEDIIIEGEEEIVLDDGASRKSDDVRTHKKQEQHKKRSNLTKTRAKSRVEDVNVTHIINPRLFCVQLKRDSGKLSALSYGLQQWCNSAASNKHRVEHVNTDDLVLAQYSADKQWYRSRVKQVISPADGEPFDKTMVEVLYVDYGNTERVLVNKLRKMQRKFLQHPEFSLDCSLVDLLPKSKKGVWSVDAVKTFAQIVENKRLQMTVIKEENNILQIDLSKPPDSDIIDDTPMSVRDALVFLELANFESPNSLPHPRGAPAPNRNYIRPETWEEGITYDVQVSFAGTPDNFYVQEIGEEFEYLQRVTVDLQSTYASRVKDSWQILCPYIDGDYTTVSPDATCLHVDPASTQTEHYSMKCCLKISEGMICVAQFTGDEMWYRARITDIPGNREVTVQYVDYGNMETISVFKLRKILDSFLILPAQAISCKLTDVEPNNSNEGWSEQSLSWWSEVVTLQRFALKIVNVEHRFHVVMRKWEWPKSDSVNLLMVMEGKGRTVGKWSEPPKVEVESSLTKFVPRLSYQTGDGFFPEPTSETDAQPVYWKSRQPRATRKYQETILTPPSSPVSNKPNTQSVTAKGDLEIPDVVHVVKLSPSKTRKRSPKPVNNNENQPMDISPTPTPPKGNQSPQKVPADSAAAPSEKPTKVKKNTKEVEVVVCHYLAPSEFYLQIAGAGRAGLNLLMKEMEEMYRNSEVAMVTFQKGNYCAVLAEDGKWYRGKIVKVLQKNLMEVFMLDFGFTEIVTTRNLRNILRQFRKERSFCFCCHLADLIPAGGMNEWSKTAIDLMKCEIHDKKLYLHKRGDLVNNSLPVDLVIETYVEPSALEPGRRTFVSLIELMKERGLAIRKHRKDMVEKTKEANSFPVLYYNKAEAVVKDGDSVMPVYVDFDGVIHCYTMEGDDQFQGMCDMIVQKFRNSEPHGSEQEWEKGQACAAFYEKDEQWHRATIVSIEPTKVQVHFIDYGNTEWVDYDQLRADIEEFIGIPQQTFLCVLHDIKPLKDTGRWEVRTLEFMHKELVNKYCKITVVEKNGFENEHMTCNLDLNGTDFGGLLVQYGMVCRGSYLTDQHQQSDLIEKVLNEHNPFKTVPDILIGGMISVIVTHVELPNVVYLQNTYVELSDTMTENEKQHATLTNENLNKLEKLSVELNKEAPLFPVIFSPKVGLPCCAQFGYDSCFYRAVIIDIYPETSQLLVLYVDYGNSEVITTQKMRSLPQKFLTLPCQSVRCRLADIEKPVDAVGWKKSSLHEMMQVLANKPLVAKITDHKPLCVELLEPDGEGEDVLVYQSVIDAGHVKMALKPVSSPPSSLEPEMPDKVTCQKSTECDKDKGDNTGVTESEASDNENQSDTSTATSTKETSAKSWAKMAVSDNSSSVDFEEVLDFTDEETSEAASTSDGSKKSDRKNKQAERRKARKGRKVEIVHHDDECFD